jgi:hypothetical protein
VRVSDKDTMSRHIFLRVFGTEIHLETDNAEIIWMVENLYEYFLVSTPFKNPSVSIRFVSGCEQTASSFGNEVHLYDVEKTTLATCLSTLWQAMISRLQDHEIFHAAAVARGERSILMLGDPESGKTTLTLGLLREGRGEFGLLAEELSVVDLRSGQVVPFPRAFTVTERTLKLFPELGSIPQRMYGKRTIKWIVSISEVLDTFSVNMGRPSAPNYILLLKAGEDFEGPAKLERLQPARAVIELCKRSLSVHSDVVRSIDIARDLVSKARCFQLKVGELDNTVKTVVSLVSD